MSRCLAGLISLGALLDVRRWAWRAELARLVLTAAGLVALGVLGEGY